MKHQPTQSITSLPASPDDERRARMIKYSVMMGIRVACIFALLFAQGWWILVFAAGAVFLPYFAVIVANVGTSRRDQEVLRPGGLMPLPPGSPGAPLSDDAAAGDDETREPRSRGDAA
ncbi:MULTISPECIES: DUF3099 domain-containing protein [Agromyces]|uniref:DUF3099 domain-containing protein n=1 Tax=Agromyces indicus TaxID=758919 RepID=A0ABU1FKK0_9MICO|nr:MULTISPECIES: DUF3099 domain-containing protein [Agromyces]KZE94280.1 hypothetical protein AVP42_01058 [Agromyces sp. NDB4Y10]MCK8610537.1 DUF3099 domain-containing protein [Agromyces sp. C10]MDR5692279.1 DUF3099 domain-containing protein [Agromyces indicus]